MKYLLKRLAILSSLVFLAACGSDDSTSTELTEEDLASFAGLQLKPYEIPAIIMLPDETANIGASTKPEVIHTETDFRWKIIVGPNFEMDITDWGSEKDLVKQKKKELANTDFLSIKYLVDEPNFILYEQQLKVKGSKKASSTVGVEHKTYHVYAEKEINKINYVFSSREEGYEKMIIELMAKSIRSVKEN